MWATSFKPDEFRMCVLDLLKGDWKKTYILYSPNGGLMVIYHGRIRKISPEKTNPR